MKKIILASGSPRRKELLEQVGIHPLVIPSKVEEKITRSDPAGIVCELSEQKCMDVALNRKEDGIYIGADTVVSADHRILGKPASIEDAVDMITMLQGRNHQVYSGVTIISLENGEILNKETFSSCTDVFVYDMTEQEIKDYVNCGECMDKAGAYGIQGAFARYVEKIDGDYNNVVGLPVAKLCQILKKFR